MNTDFFAAKLNSRALIRVQGADWRTFLQGLLTQDVETLADGEIRFAALLTPQGKLLYDLFLIGQGDGALIDVAAAHREALMRRLMIYRLRAKVEIVAQDEPVAALWPAASAPPSPGWIADPRLTSLGFRGYGSEAPHAARLVDEDAYDAHRLALGAPDPAKDCPPEATYPIEADFDLLNGIDFHKGCFVGQETTSRMKRRGAIKTRMVAVAFDGPPPAFGAEVLAGALRAGEMRSARDGRGMALLRLDRIGGDLAADGRKLTLAPGEFLAEALRANGLPSGGAVGEAD